MTSHLSSEAIQQLAPLLGSLARMIANGSQLNDGELQTLLLGAGLDSDLTVLEELKLWGRLLKGLRGLPSPEQRHATVEALMLRNVPEASALLAVDTIFTHVSKPIPLSGTSSRRRLCANPSNLDFGTLSPGQAGSGTFEVQGGPGRVVVESDQLRVTPLQFGNGTTPISVATKPLMNGLLWTTLRLVTADETLEVPILAQWTDVTTAASLQQTPNSDSDIDLTTMIEQAMGLSLSPVENTPTVNAQPQGNVGTDNEILTQLRRLLG